MKVELKVVGGSRAGQSIPIAIPQFMIGRADDCHLKPRSELISRYHCTILSEEAYVAIRDLGSKNGVYVNGERIVGEQELKNGDHIVVGPLEFEVVLTVALKAPMKSKVTSMAEIVARTVEQNSINVATAKQAQVASQPTPAPAQPAPVQPAAPAQPAPVQPAAPAQPAPVQAAAPAQPAPVQAAAPAQPAPVQPAAPAQPAPVQAAASVQETEKRTATHASPALAPTSSAFTVAPIQTSSSSSSDDGDSNDFADWLLDGDDESSEAQTVSMAAIDDLDLPYAPKEEEKEEQPAEEKTKNAPMPNSSDAAANLLKNFFKGGGR